MDLYKRATGCGASETTRINDSKGSEQILTSFLVTIMIMIVMMMINFFFVSMFSRPSGSSSWLYGDRINAVLKSLRFELVALRFQDLLSSHSKSLRFELMALRSKIFCGSYNVSPAQARGSTVSRSLSEVEEGWVRGGGDGSGRKDKHGTEKEKRRQRKRLPGSPSLRIGYFLRGNINIIYMSLFINIHGHELSTFCGETAR